MLSLINGIPLSVPLLKPVKQRRSQQNKYFPFPLTSDGLADQEAERFDIGSWDVSSRRSIESSPLCVAVKHCNWDAKFVLIVYSRKIFFNSFYTWWAIFCIAKRRTLDIVKSYFLDCLYVCFTIFSYHSETFNHGIFMADFDHFSIGNTKSVTTQI